MTRSSRIGLSVLGVVVLLPLLLLFALMIIGNTDSGRRFIEHTTSDLTHDQVILQGLAGRFPDRLRLGPRSSQLGLSHLCRSLRRRRRSS